MSRARSPRRLLGIDLGAASLKATLVDSSGTVVAAGSAPIATDRPHAGWQEQAPQAWRAALVQALAALAACPGARDAPIAGVGVSGGAHIAVLEDAAGAVIRPAILWSDQRSALEARQLAEALGDSIVEHSLNRPNPTWTLCHLLWLAANEPEALARTRRLYLAKDYLRACLTGDWCTDPSDAVGSLMAERGGCGFSDALVRHAGLAPHAVPPVRRATEIAGTVTAEAAALTGLAAGTPVVVGSNDTTVELFGAGALLPGEGAIKLASAGVVYLATAKPEVHPPVSCYPHLVAGRWYMAAGINSCATAHRWVRDLLYRAEGEDGFRVMDEDARGVAPGADGLTFHPYLLGERAPHWDPRLRGAFLGLSLGHERRHFARACYEGIAFALRDARDDMIQRSGARLGSVRMLGGGARSATWCGIVADVMGLAVARPENADASFGSALAAGVGVGVFASPADALARCVRVRDVIEPQPRRVAAYGERFRIYDDARRSLTPISHRLDAHDGDGVRR